MEPYAPELGQMFFGQPWQPIRASELCIAALQAIDKELSRIKWNIEQKGYNSPFANTGNSFKCDAFEVEAYSWNEEVEQKFNFKWQDVEVSWYKYLGRGTNTNIQLTPDRINEMLESCLEALSRYETANDPYMMEKAKNDNLQTQHQSKTTDP